MIDNLSEEKIIFFSKMLEKDTILSSQSLKEMPLNALNMFLKRDFLSPLPIWKLDEWRLLVFNAGLLKTISF